MLAAIEVLLIPVPPREKRLREIWVYSCAYTYIQLHLCLCLALSEHVKNHELIPVPQILMQAQRVHSKVFSFSIFATTFSSSKKSNFCFSCYLIYLLV